MKTTFVIFGLLIAFFKTGSTEPTETTRLVNAALGKCATELNLKKEEVIEQTKPNVLPEDNASLIKFFACFSNELGFLNEAGDINFEKLLPVVQDMIKQRLGNVEDVDAKAKSAATAAIEQCKSTPKAEDPGLSVIKLRNCIRGVTLKAKN